MHKSNILYQVGDKVLLKKDSRFWKYNDENNPQNTLGTVVYIGETAYKVKWEGKGSCAFQDMDLEPFEEKLELVKLQSNSLHG